MTRFKLLFLLLLFPFVAAPQRMADEPPHVSLLQVIARPEDYDGKIIEVIGFLQIDWEGARLYLHQEDFDHSIISDSLTADQTKEMAKEREKLDMSYVRIVGRFRVGNKPYHYGSVGEITEIKSYQLWSQPGNPRGRRMRNMVKHDSEHK